MPSRVVPSSTRGLCSNWVLDEQRLDEIETQLKEYMLDDGAFEMNSDAEDVERDEESEIDDDEERADTAVPLADLKIGG
ncbi:hypothetical protein M422DRAFT_239105 [Sphaerobolus stellatus SS14]|nr:hypothetical protein M422DRAFT_239105 [Sphaerobolus stellatus SS14]